MSRIMSTTTPRKIIVTRPDGTETTYNSQSEAARAEPVTQAILSMMCRGKKESYEGYKARFAPAVQ